MRVLGIYCGHDSSMAVAQDGQVIFACEEERLTGIKKQGGFPARSLLQFCDEFECGIHDFDRVVIATPNLHWGRTTADDTNQYLNLYPDATFIHHHKAHAVLAYCWSGWHDAHVFTCDGGGDKYFATINRGYKGELEMKHGCRKDMNEALGMLYYYVTEALGFTPNRHEGKVMGLAAHGKDTDIFKSLFWIDGKDIRALGSRDEMIVFKRLNEKAIGSRREDIAASCQSHFSKVLKDWIITNMIKGKLSVSGGCFANVLCNMEISNLPEVESLYVAPAMLDDGLSAGAALSAFNPLPVKRQRHVYLGPKQLPRIQNQYCADDVADMIIDGKVVGLFQGRMEFGPRALGNRSILYDARDRKSHSYLNKRLNRTEIMPFAPVILEEYADEILVDYHKQKDNAPFMTTCFKVRDEWKDKIQAVVHIDGTVRPQVIEHDINPYYYEIIEEFRKKTGIPVLINTSFNAHEDPIVCFNREADWALKTGKIDILVEN